MADPIGTSGAARSAGRTRDRSRDVRMVTVGVVAVLLVWFALANLQDVQIHFWVTTTRAPLIIVVLISGLLGALIGAAARRRKRPTPEA